MMRALAFLADRVLRWHSPLDWFAAALEVRVHRNARSVVDAIGLPGFPCDRSGAKFSITSPDRP
jgi:hypothetical protein